MEGEGRMRRFSIFRCTLFLSVFLSVCLPSTASPQASKSSWGPLIAEAEALRLPTRFLRMIPSDFITLEFEDLHTFAAEYHPEDHRMLLNLSLSFNGAGGALKPLAEMTHREAGTLYHEFFHAYMDYLASKPEATGQDGARLLAFARNRQRCQYQVVSITPVVQKKSVTEPRWLSEEESWEALNETWAVFVGWAVWTKLEIGGGPGAEKPSASAIRREWLSRLKKADRDGDLAGYYEPRDQEERTKAQKRYLAPSHRITPAEVILLLETLSGEAKTESRRSAAVMEQRRPHSKDSPPCED